MKQSTSILSRSILLMLVLTVFLLAGCMANLPGKVDKSTPAQSDAGTDSPDIAQPNPDDAASLPVVPDGVQGIIEGTVESADGSVISAANAIPAGTTYTDPWQYCSAARTIDSPGIEYVGEKPPAALKKALLDMLDITENDAGSHNIVWRCMDGNVYACDVTLSTHCLTPMRLISSPTRAMIDACQDPGMEGITLPTAVTGPETPYEWTCIEKVPTITRQGIPVDERGFNAAIWHAILAPLP